MASNIRGFGQTFIFYCNFFVLSSLFALSFLPGSTQHPLIDDGDLAISDNVYVWLRRMMRAEPLPYGSNTIDPRPRFPFPPLEASTVEEPFSGGDGDLVISTAMDDVDNLIKNDRNTSLIPNDFGGIFKQGDILGLNDDYDRWTLCQLPVFVFLCAIFGVLVVTFIVLRWLKKQMLNEKNPSGNEASKMVCPCPTHRKPDDRWIFHSVINLKNGAEEKQVLAVQPSDTCTEPIVSKEAFTPTVEMKPHERASSTPTETPVATPERRQEVVRVRAKGLLERRGSNVSLTIDLPHTSEATPHVITPTRECSAEEFLLSAGNTLCLGQLKSCLADIGSLHREFWDIPLNHPDVTHAVGCSGKNRYKSILPNEKTRVRLENTEDSYINANYIRGYDGEEKAYIATQGPLGNTVSDLYHMIWSHRSPIIVMMTHLVEKTKTKCDQYFPLEVDETITFGDFDVTVEELVSRQGYVIRHLLLKYKGETRRLLHYWYDTWPDHKTPQNVQSILAMATEVESVRASLKHPKSANNNETKEEEVGPVVVHCSAGIGRTGCFIAITLAICQLLEENKVDLLGIVCQLRYDRGGMIQTAEQYEFVHRAVAAFAATLPDSKSPKERISQ